MSWDGMDPGLGPGADFGFSGAGNPSLLRGTGCPDPLKSLNWGCGEYSWESCRSVCRQTHLQDFPGLSWTFLDGSWQPEPTDPAITCQVVTIGLCETSDGGGVVSPSGRYKRLRSDTKTGLRSTFTMSSTNSDSRTVVILENRWSRARKVGRDGNICPH